MSNNSVESNTLGLRLNGVNTRKEESDNASYYVGFLKYDSSGRPQIIYFDSNFYYNPYSETLFATNFSGSIVSTSVNITSDTASTDPQYLCYVAGIGTQNVKIAMSSGYVYYPSTDTLSTLGNLALTIGTVGYGVSGPQSALYISGQNSTDTKTTAGVHLGQDQADTYASMALVTSSATGVPYIKFAVSGTAFDAKIEYDCGDDEMRFYINAATPSLVDFSTNEIKLTGNGYSRLRYYDSGAAADKKTVITQNEQGAYKVLFLNDAGSSTHAPVLITREASATVYADITKFSCNAFIVYEKTGVTQALNIDNVNTTINSLYALGVNDVALPLVPLVVRGTSGPVLGTGLGGIFHITTGTGVQLDDKLMLGVVDGDYSWLQAIDADVGFKNLCLNPGGGNVGIGTTVPTEKLHISGNIKTDNLLYVKDRIIGGESNVANNCHIDCFDNGTASLGRSMYLNYFANVGVGYSIAINAQASPRTYGLYVIGNSYFSSYVAKPAGSFNIKHPVLGEDYRLIHSFVEGPRADNIYRGKVKLINGTIDVNIDTENHMTEGTFVALNTNFNIYVSNNDENSWDLVKGKLNGNILKICSNNPVCNAEIDYMVVGERQDEYMKSQDCNMCDLDGKVIVERPSTPWESGKINHNNSESASWKDYYNPENCCCDMSCYNL